MDLKVKLIAGAVAGVVGTLAISIVAANSVFYAEPGYIYHVRTVTGSEHVVSDVGYQFYLWGRWNPWKRALTVQAVQGGNHVSAEEDSDSTSASMPPMNIMFLDQVDANAEATVRFSIPSDPESFLRIAHEYRTPDNFLRTALIPAFKETLQANASLMSAEDYYAGSRTEFNTEFENQMNNGTYLVRREEKRVEIEERAEASANASLGTDQQEYGSATKMVYVVTKQTDITGTPIRNPQKFSAFGVTVVDARITNMTPNAKFVERMSLKQKASADRAIAREQRIQEEEQRLLAIAKGDREVAERQAQARVEQIQLTTGAETDKQLALTAATKLKEQAAIERETAGIQLEKAKLEAQTTKTLADAEAYQKERIMKADNALAQKLEAEVQIQAIWAKAFAERKVPTNGFGAGSAPTGSDSETTAFMQMLTLDAAKRLSYDRSIEQK